MRKYHPNDSTLSTRYCNNGAKVICMPHFLQGKIVVNVSIIHFSTLVFDFNRRLEKNNDIASQD